MKKVDLGDLRGDIVIFGGVYSNLHALEALINHTINCGVPPSQRNLLWDRANSSIQSPTFGTGTSV